MPKCRTHDTKDNRSDKNQCPRIEKSLKLRLICGECIENSWIGNSGNKLKDCHKKTTQPGFKSSQSTLCAKFARCGDEQTAACCAEYRNRNQRSSRLSVKPCCNRKKCGKHYNHTHNRPIKAA